MERVAEAVQRRRRVPNVIPPNYVTLQQLKEKKEQALQKQKKEEKEEEEEKKQEVERKLQDPSVRPRSNFPPNYMTLQQLKERKEHKLQRDKEEEEKKQEDEDRKKLEGVSRHPSQPRRAYREKRVSLVSGSEESTAEDTEKENLRQAAKNRVQGTTTTGVPEDNRRRNGRRLYQRKIGTDSSREKNGPVHVNHDPRPSVEQVCRGKANRGESVSESPRVSEIVSAKENGSTDLHSNASLSAAKTGGSAAKGSPADTKSVEQVVERSPATVKAGELAAKGAHEDEGENEEEKKKKKRPFRKRYGKKPQNQARVPDTEDSANRATIDKEVTVAVAVAVIDDAPARKEREENCEARMLEKKTEGESIGDLQKDLVRKIVPASPFNGRQRRPCGGDSGKRASPMWVKKEELWSSGPGKKCKRKLYKQAPNL